MKMKGNEMQKIATNLPRGRRGIPLPTRTRKALLRVLTTENISYEILADRIGITRSQLEHPLRGGKCSVESYDKIQAFMAGEK